MAKYGILSRYKDKYTTKEKTKGYLGRDQPHYWNQGIGRTKALPKTEE